MFSPEYLQMDTIDLMPSEDVLRGSSLAWMAEDSERLEVIM